MPPPRKKGQVSQGTERTRKFREKQKQDADQLREKIQSLEEKIQFLEQQNSRLKTDCAMGNCHGQSPQSEHDRGGRKYSENGSDTISNCATLSTCSSPTSGFSRTHSGSESDGSFHSSHAHLSNNPNSYQELSHTYAAEAAPPTFDPNLSPAYSAPPPEGPPPQGGDDEARFGFSHFNGAMRAMTNDASSEAPHPNPAPDPNCVVPQWGNDVLSAEEDLSMEVQLLIRRLRDENKRLLEREKACMCLQPCQLDATEDGSAALSDHQNQSGLMLEEGDIANLISPLTDMPLEESFTSQDDGNWNFKVPPHPVTLDDIEPTLTGAIIGTDPFFGSNSELPDDWNQSDSQKTSYPGPNELSFCPHPQKPIGTILQTPTGIYHDCQPPPQPTTNTSPSPGDSTHCLLPQEATNTEFINCQEAPQPLVNTHRSSNKVPHHDSYAYQETPLATHVTNPSRETFEVLPQEETNSSAIGSFNGQEAAQQPPGPAQRSPNKVPRHTYQDTPHLGTPVPNPSREIYEVPQPVMAARASAENSVLPLDEDITRVILEEFPLQEKLFHFTDTTGASASYKVVITALQVSPIQVITRKRHSSGNPSHHPSPLKRPRPTQHVTPTSPPYQYSTNQPVPPVVVLGTTSA
uniref:BZIP domain-containing protein n=1 Tax=Steinernema glaseri TaxID=37863 RepID=A0A1I7XZG1_9BILA